MYICVCVCVCVCVCACLHVYSSRDGWVNRKWRGIYQLSECMTRRKWIAITLYE